MSHPRLQAAVTALAVSPLDCHIDVNTETGQMYPEVITTYLVAD